MTESKVFRDCTILATECLTIREAIRNVIRENLQWIIIKSDFEVIVNSINGKLNIHKDIINLVKNIRILTFVIRDIRIEYCDTISRDATIMEMPLSILSFNFFVHFSF